MDKTEGKQTSFCLFHGFRQTGQGNAKADYSIIRFTNYQSNQVQTEHGYIHFYIIIDLLLCKRNKAIQGRIRLIKRIEYLLNVRHNVFGSGKLHHL